MSRTSLPLLALVALAGSVAPRAAAAHGVTAEVDRRDGSVAVRARYEGGKALADAVFEVRSPRGGDAPFAQGRTDRHGWLAFTPDAPGTWTVRIADAGGHGKTVEVQVAPAASAAARTPERAGAPSPTIQLSPEGGGERTSPPETGWTGSYAFRALVAATAIVLVFRILLGVQRARRGKAR